LASTARSLFAVFKLPPQTGFPAPDADDKKFYWCPVTPTFSIKRSATVEMRSLTAIVQREDDSWISFCPELDVASQGEFRVA
jgi:hypothetical protein